MTAMPPLRDILNNTPANAIDVDFNFNTIEGHIGQELINRDGSVAMTGALTLAGPPVAVNQAATKGYVDAYTPVGVITMYGGAVAPAGWTLCDGSVKSQTDPLYVDLYAVIGTSYNTGGEGPGNFRLPNLKAKMPVGFDAGDALYNSLGKTGGSKNAVLVSHRHTVDSHRHTGAPHVHAMNHAHSGSIAAVAAHNHWAADAIDTFFAHGRLGGVAHSAVAPPGANTFADLHNLVTSSEGAHTHGLTIDAQNGNTQGAAFSDQTGAAAPLTDFQGVSATNANIPPYVTLNFIIRIG